MGNNTATKSDDIEKVTQTQPSCQILQNFLLIWLDANFEESEPDFRKSLQELRRVVTSINLFTNERKCIDFLRSIEQEQIFMIVSGSLGRRIIPKIEDLPQLESVYVFCMNKMVHEQWSREISKVKGVYTDIGTICKALRVDGQNCDRNTISISLNGVDASFMYTQLLKEAILEIKDDDEKSITGLVDYCRSRNDINSEDIAVLENSYRDETPIWWYTSPYFIYTMLNRCLRLMEIEVIMKLGFFIRHLHQDIYKLHYTQQATVMTQMENVFTVFRGQVISCRQFERIQQKQGDLMSFNNFLSTSLNREVALQFARSNAKIPCNLVCVLFVMEIDPTLCKSSSIPFADVGTVGYYKKKEAEILFTTHTIFRINNVRQIPDRYADQLWEITLTLTSDSDNKFKELTTHLRPGLRYEGWARFGEILLRLGESTKVEQLCNLLLEKSSNNKERAICHSQLGRAYKSMGEYSKAIWHCEKYREIKMTNGIENDVGMATYYDNIGEVYYGMGDYPKALSSHQKALEIMQRVLSLNHPDLASTYNNLGNVYYSIGNHSQALSSYQQAINIKKAVLPQNHPDLAQFYVNIGLAYDSMGKYSEALVSQKKALEIKKIVLPPNHIDFAISYNNIGTVYHGMRQYSEALSSYQQALRIKQISLPSTHPSMATSHNNIGLVHENLGQYSDALLCYETAREIWETSLPPTHPNIATVQKNIEDVRRKI